MKYLLLLPLCGCETLTEMAADPGIQAAMAPIAENPMGVISGGPVSWTTTAATLVSAVVLYFGGKMAKAKLVNPAAPPPVE